MRCAVDGCRPAPCASCLRLTVSGCRASTSNSAPMRSMTWMELFDSESANGASLSNQAILPERAERPRRYAKLDCMRVGLFVTCLVDAMRPSIGISALRLLELAGCDVIVPRRQTCCGQPGWNSGERSSALALAQ